MVAVTILLVSRGDSIYVFDIECSSICVIRNNWASFWENRSSGVPTRSHTNQAVQSLKMARGLKFRIQKVKDLYYQCSENKGADQLRWSASLFSHMQKSVFLTTRLNYCWYI